MKKRVEITKQTVMRAVREGSCSLTAVWRACGGEGSVAGSTSRRMRQLVPDIDARIRKNKGSASVGAASTETTTRTGRKAGVRTEYPRPECDPYREGSSYSAAFRVLHDHKDKGIERAKLVKEVARLTGKDERKAYFDVAVVASSRKDGRSHRCIARAADSYYVERTEGGWLKLVLR